VLSNDLKVWDINESFLYSATYEELSKTNIIIKVLKGGSTSDESKKVISEIKLDIFSACNGPATYNIDLFSEIKVIY
jgi:hypothetical protein